MKREKGNRIEEACQLLVEQDICTKTDQIPITESYGRVLAERIAAETAVPSFRRSAYDGYAVRRSDIAWASEASPVTLGVMETIPAGRIGHYPVTEGKAARIMTGAAVPAGADAVVMHELTRFTDTEVTFFAPAGADNIVPAGEDVQLGECLAEAGKVIGAADVALFAGQGMQHVRVYKRPEAALLSTGSELLMPGETLAPGKIYNTNPYLLQGYLLKYGMLPKVCGIVPDEKVILAERIEEALETSDLVITTGGVSAGDYDYIPSVVEQIGADILFHRLPFKPGGAMLAAVREKKVILGLSGNPGAAAVGLLRVGLPYLKKLCGRSETAFTEVDAFLEEPFQKSSVVTRMLRGQGRIREGRLFFHIIDNQKNGSVSSMQDCDLLGEIPPGENVLLAGSRIKAYII